MISPEYTVLSVGSDHRHISHAVANLKAADAIAELINFADDIIAEHQGRPTEHRLRVEVTPDYDVSVFHA
jgi:hypothetical protein